MESSGLILREDAPYNARGKNLTPTPKAAGLHQEFSPNLNRVETILCKGPQR